MALQLLTTYPWYKPAGLAPRLWRASSALGDAGHDIDWVAVAPPDLTHSRVHFHLLHASPSLATSMPNHKSRSPWAFYMWHGSRLCRTLARDAQTRCLFAFSYGASFPLLSAQRASGKPLAIFLRSNEQQENDIKGVSFPMKWIFRSLEARAVRAATTIVPITQALADVMAQRHGEAIRSKFEILHNDLPAPPTDLSACRRETHNLVGDANAFVITSNGPFNERKNFATLIDAFGHVKHDHAKLLLVGDGPLRADQERQVAALGMGDRVCFAGWRDDAARLTAGSDLFVLPSQAEGVSNSLMEALTADVPCLVSDIPEHAEILPVEDLRFKHDSIDQLALKLQQAITEPERLEALRIACRAGATKLRFDWNARVVDIIQSMTTQQLSNLLCK